MPAAESLVVDTVDGVAIACTYYPGGVMRSRDGKHSPKEGKEVVPIILLHGWEGQRQQFDPVASYLQQFGHAVIVPDLRGHGRSVTQRLGAMERTLDPARFRRDDFLAMVNDVRAVKGHLFKENNAEKLNIELLTVVGADMGALVGMTWAIYDWSLPQLPTIKQGRDVKALVMLTPPKSFKGLNATAALRSPVIAKGLRELIIVGARDTQGLADAKNLFTSLARGRDDPPKDLFMLEPDTSLSGVALLTAPGVAQAPALASFIEGQIARHAKDPEFAWRNRGNPLESAP